MKIGKNSSFSSLKHEITAKISAKMDELEKNIGFPTVMFINLPNNEVKYIY